MTEREEEQKETGRVAHVVYTNQTPYYRRLNEPIGESLYRDYMNREKRARLVQYCQAVKQEKRSKYHARVASKELADMRESNL